MHRLLLVTAVLAAACAHVRTLPELEQECAAGNGESCTQAGARYGQTDGAKGFAYYEKGCTAGDPSGCANSAILLERGQGVGQDLPRSLEFREKACDLEKTLKYGMSDCNDLAQALEEYHPALTRIADAYRRGCDHGNYFSCLGVSSAYATGQGVAKDESLALAFAERACSDARNTAKTGCDVVGDLQAKGVKAAAIPPRTPPTSDGPLGLEPAPVPPLDSFPEDKRELLAHAAEMLPPVVVPAEFIKNQKQDIEACEKHRPTPGSTLGPCTYFGNWITSNTGNQALASLFYRKGCLAGEKGACYSAGLALALTRVGMLTPYRKAGRLLTQLDCEAGVAGACFSMATTAKTPAETVAWYERACKLGDQMSCGNAQSSAALFHVTAAKLPAVPPEAKALVDLAAIPVR